MAADGTAAIAAPKTRRVEPEHRRTHQRVRRNSRLRGRCEAGWWVPFDPKTKAAMMLAAERYGQKLKPFGKRAVAKQSTWTNAIAVLRELLRVVDYKSGRLEPSLKTIAGRVRLNKETVVRALATLKAWGFVDWIRRYAETGQPGARGGVQVEQTSNAYRLTIPEAARKLLGKLFAAPPGSEDAEVHEAGVAAQRRQNQLDDPNDPLGSALRRLDPSTRNRESGDVAESGQRSD